MAALEFSIRQRIFLEVLLGQQRGSVEDIEVFFDIRNKVKLEDKESFLRSLPSGELIIDEVSAAAAGFEKIELEKEERKSCTISLRPIKDSAQMTLSGFFRSKNS